MLKYINDIHTGIGCFNKDNQTCVYIYVGGCFICSKNVDVQLNVQLVHHAFIQTFSVFNSMYSEIDDSGVRRVGMTLFLRQFLFVGILFDQNLY